MKQRHLRLAPSTICACGHSYPWHATPDGRCTHELKDTTNNAWMRCACDRFRGRE